MKYLFIPFLLLISANAMASESAIDLKIAIDSLWVVVATMLVFFMQAGFAMLEVGLHSPKNTANVLMKNIMDFVIASLGFWAVGFALMFGNGNSLIGSTGWFLDGGNQAFSSLSWATMPISIKFVFQLVFAGTAATIISGAIGGRVKFASYLLLSLGITTIIYPILGHWIWGGGWLSEMGFFDFAGSTVVHGVGGFAALAAALVIGRRHGRFDEDGKPVQMASNSVVMVGLGTLILWLGWFGFNAGSTMSMVGSENLVGHILLTTNLAAAAGALLAMATSLKIYNRFDITMTLNGALAGLVGITAGCAFVDSIGAVAIGAISGVLMVYAGILLEKLKIDDVVGAVAVHGACGIWGTIAIGLFAASPFSGAEGQPAIGLLYGGEWSQLMIQTFGTLLVCSCAFVATYLLCKGIDMVLGLRVEKAEEIRGLDMVEHGHDFIDYDILVNQDKFLKEQESYNEITA